MCYRMRLLVTDLLSSTRGRSEAPTLPRFFPSANNGFSILSRTTFFADVETSSSRLFTLRNDGYAAICSAPRALCALTTCCSKELNLPASYSLFHTHKLPFSSSPLSVPPSPPGWFGGGAAKPAQKDFTSHDESNPFDHSSDSPQGFSAQGPATNFGHGGGGGASQLEQVAAALQERQLVQQVVAKLTELSFDACVGKPDTQLSGREVGCIHATVGKFLDTSELVLGRIARKQQQAGAGGH